MISEFDSVQQCDKELDLKRATDALHRYCMPKYRSCSTVWSLAERFTPLQSGVEAWRKLKLGQLSSSGISSLQLKNLQDEHI